VCVAFVRAAVALECTSHYWLDRGTVDWAAMWSRAPHRRRPSRNKAPDREATHETRSTDPGPTTDSEPGWVRRYWDALRRWGRLILGAV